MIEIRSFEDLLFRAKHRLRCGAGTRRFRRDQVIAWLLLRDERQNRRGRAHVASQGRGTRHAS